MSDAKTKPTDADLGAFLDAVEPATRRADARRLCDMMARISGEPPCLWGPSIVGFGSYHYRYASGREGNAPRVGFSPRKSALVLYVMDGFAGRDALLERLGKHKAGKACLYVNRLSDVDADVLETLITRSLEAVAVQHGVDSRA